MVNHEEPFEFRELGDKAAELRRLTAPVAGEVALEAVATVDTTATRGIEHRPDGSYTVPNYGGGARITIY